MDNIHASCVFIKQKGILILGDSGSGKSDLCLRLIMEFGAKLVADDRVDIKIEKNGKKEVVTLGKQKYNIATLENQCNKYFKALGELYYNNIKDSEIEDTQINYLVNNISHTKSQIKLIKKD